MATTNTIQTENADLIAYHARETGHVPQMHIDRLTGKVVAEVSTESRDAFFNDSTLQRYLSTKQAVWRVISRLRSGGVR